MLKLGLVIIIMQKCIILSMESYVQVLLGFIDEHNWEIIFAIVAAIIAMIFCEILKNAIWISISLLVPNSVLLAFIDNKGIKDALGRLIELLNYNVKEPLSKGDKLVKLIILPLKSFIVWKVRHLMIAYLEQRISNEPDPNKKRDIGILIVKIKLSAKRKIRKNI